jgi:hypothetical protein
VHAGIDQAAKAHRHILSLLLKRLSQDAADRLSERPSAPGRPGPERVGELPDWEAPIPSNNLSGLRNAGQITIEGAGLARLWATAPGWSPG